MGVTSIRLQSDVESGLEAAAARLQRSRNWLVNEAVREYVARLDREQQRWKETLGAVESVAQGRVVAGDAVHAWLRSWGQPGELPPPGEEW